MNDALRISLYHKVPCDAHDVTMMVVAKMIMMMMAIIALEGNEAAKSSKLLRQGFPVESLPAINLSQPG